MRAVRAPVMPSGLRAGKGGGGGGSRGRSHPGDHISANFTVYDIQPGFHKTWGLSVCKINRIASLPRRNKRREGGIL